MTTTPVLRIRDVEARPVVAPLASPVRTASGAVMEAPLLLVDLRTEEGPVGRAYLFESLGLLPPDEAAEAAARAVAAGFRGLKIKVGWPSLAQDLAAVRAARRALPDDVALMVDFNQSLSIAEAIRRGRALDGEGVTWIEEPVRADDLRGAAQVAAALQTPVQIGENFSGPLELAEALRLGAADLVMPDVQQIGGVTGWLRAAALAGAAGVPCSSHLFIEASAHLLAVTPTCHWLEYLDVAAPVLAEPLRPVGGSIEAPARPGLGLVWDEAAVRRYAAG